MTEHRSFKRIVRARMEKTGESYIVDFADEGRSKSTVAIAHERLPDAAEAERLKAAWRGSVSRLREELER